MSRAYFFSIHSLSDVLEEIILLSLIVAMSHFLILWKNFAQPHIIFKRECPLNNITHVLRYFDTFL